MKGLFASLCLFVSTLSFQYAEGSSSQGPRFLQEPPGPRLDFSNTTGAVLPCVAQGSPIPRLQWLSSGGAPAIDVPGLRHTRPDGSLVFLPFRSEEYRPDVHGATYRCSASNEVGTILSRDVKVKGVVLQPYVVDVYDEFVVRGNTAVLRCRVPPPVHDYVSVTSWIRDGSFVIRPTALAGDRFSIFPSGELHIHRVDHSDGLQQFRCETRHRLTGENVLSATAGRLLVTDTFREAAPRIISSQRLLRAPAGSTLEAPCAAQGFPPPLYTWYRNQEAVLSPLQPFGSRLMQLEGTLLVREVGLGDSGSYVCRVTNGKGEDSAETQIRVTAPLSVQVVPKSQIVDVGQPATFNCSMTGYPVSSVEWLKDGRTLRPGPGLNFPSRDRVRIVSVRHQDAGMYQCLVSNDVDSAQGTAQLTLGDYPPKLLEVFSEQTLPQGTPLSVRCVAQGRPLPQITWTLDDTPVPESASRLRMGDYVRPGGRVVSYVNVSSASPVDGGHYACVAENNIGRAIHMVHVKVSGPPLVRPMANVTAVAGGSLRLMCPVGGHPIESIRWGKDGSRLPLNHRQKVFLNGTLHIRNVEASSDAGRYSCAAANAEGLSAESSMYVAVLVRPSIDPFSFPKNLQQGQRYNVLCTVTQGDPPVRIRWTKDGELLPGDRVRAIPVTEFSSTLVFESLTPEQRGNYTCTAQNRAGQDSHSASLLIHVPPLWRIEPTDSSATLSKPAVVDCQADGFPVPRIRWTKAEGSGDFRPISSSSRLHVFENGSLVLHNAQPEDAGQYLCQANNNIGPGISKVIMLSVHAAAHFDNKFRTETIGKGEDARLVCEAGGDRPLHITWLKDKLPLETDPRYDLTETVVGEGATSILLIRRSSRRDSALYTCVAANAYGTDDTNIQLIVKEAPDPPSDAKVLEVGSRSAKIGWSAPFGGNSPLQRYVVLYREETAQDRWQQEFRNMSVPRTETSVVVSGLTPVTFYQFRLHAENALGQSEPSNILHLRTEQEAPGGPPQKVKVHATGAHTLKVTWKAPRKELQHGNIEGYYVGYRLAGSKEPFVYKTLRTEGEAQLTALKKITEYEVLVQAYNSKGASPPSDTVLAKTLENDPPGSPVVRITFTNHSCIGIAWEETDVVQGYVVHYKWELGDWTEVETTDTELALCDLRCGSRYHVYVSAYNSAGKGPPSDVLRTQSEGRAPIAPDKQSLVSVNQTSAFVFLSSWMDGGCPIRLFAVRYRQQRYHQWASAAVTGQTVSLEDLTPSTWYRLQVTAHNEAGSTDAEYTFVTSPSKPGDSSLDQLLPLYWDMNVLVPAAVSLAVLLALLMLICLLVHKRRRPSQTMCADDDRKTPESLPLSEKNSLKKALSSPAYYPTPYATTRVQEPKEGRQALDEPLYATVKRTPRPPRSDFHVYHYPGEMSDFLMPTGDSDLGACSSNVFWKDRKLQEEYRSQPTLQGSESKESQR